MILSLFRKDPNHEAAAALFEAAVSQSRAPAFYLAGGAPDTVEGRFEVLTLHLFLVLDRLKRLKGGKNLSQQVFDAFFANIDDSLREMGVGDLSVGKKVRAYAEAFYGRAGAYGDALKPEASQTALEEALSRNVYGAHGAPQAGRLARYVRDVARGLADQPDGRLRAGVIAFPPALSEEKAPA